MAKLDGAGDGGSLALKILIVIWAVLKPVLVVLAAFVWAIFSLASKNNKPRR